MPKSTKNSDLIIQCQICWGDWDAGWPAHKGSHEV